MIEDSRKEFMERMCEEVLAEVDQIGDDANRRAFKQRLMNVN